ncbi:MAG: phage portal protein [Ancalomicrobiaceae bacterium]|nr:phage portal protein [Ancalomicrobiaceae bacterium]
MTPFELLRRWVVPGALPTARPPVAPPAAASPLAEIKSSRAGPLISLHFVGRPVWTPRDYAGLAREGYARNPIVYRCVRLISEAASSVPWLLYQGRHELDRHPLLDLLASPNPRQSGAQWLEELYGHLLVSGNAYIEAVALGGHVRELYCLRPDRVKVVPGAEGWPEAWDYTVGERSVRFSARAEPVRPILNLNLFHPLNDYYGMAPIEAAQVSLDVHNAASSWAKSLIDNSARPSGALVYQSKDGSNLSDEQFTRLKKELEDGFQGANNAGRPLLLEGGLDWKSMGLSPKEMDFIEAKRDAAREIALAFGVPSMILGIPGDLTHANYAEANRAFWRSTVLPLISRTAQALGTWLDPAFGPGLRLAFDTDQIEALATDRDQLWRRVDAASFLSEDEKRAVVGYGPRLPAASAAAQAGGGSDGSVPLPGAEFAKEDADPVTAADPAAPSAGAADPAEDIEPRGTADD